MAAEIYAIHNDGRSVALVEQQFVTEDLMQRHLADIPALLPGAQIDPASPRRWLLVSREMPLASEADSGDRWEVDHLFVDQDSIPTIVEVKRSSDSRIRREVVGQMLEYAANAVAYWPVEKIRSKFEANNPDHEERLAGFLQGVRSAEEFWTLFKTNLQAGRVRMIFVADRIPSELKRIVEFLNEQMDTAEVLAVEIRQFVGDGLKTLVPQLIGLTARAEQKRSPSSIPSPWTEDRFFEVLGSAKGEVQAGIARQILSWSGATGTRLDWGRGTTLGSFTPVLRHEKVDHFLFSVLTTGQVETQFQYYRSRPPFTAEEKRRELLERLNTIPGVAIPADAISRRPSFALSLLEPVASMSAFLATFEWFIREVTSVAASDVN